MPDITLGADGITGITGTTDATGNRLSSGA